MKINTNPGDRAAISYATIKEADKYVLGRDGFDKESWSVLTEEQKAFRLAYGAYIIDSQRYRGIKACVGQALQFPRITRSDGALWEANSPFSDYDTLQEFAALMDVPAPVVPKKVKFAQIEATYQIVHSHILTLEPFDTGEEGISALTIDDIHLSFRKSGKSAYSLFCKADFGAASTISLLLQEFLFGGIRGALI